MVEELKNYIAEEYSVDKSKVTAEYDQIWENYNDMIVKDLEMESIYAPYYVMFAVKVMIISRPNLWILRCPVLLRFSKLEENS